MAGLRVALAVLLFALPLAALDTSASLDDPVGCVEELTAGGIPVPCDGIRPGARITSPSGCTLAWILEDEGDLYATTAGHCVGGVGDVVRIDPGNGPEVDIGTVVYAINQGDSQDFAVIDIYPEVEGDVNPQLCHWGGPTGMVTGDVERGDVVRQYGHGIAISVLPETRARSGLVSYDSGTSYGFYGVVTNGDSGSPVMMADGSALGVLNTLGTSFSFSGNPDDIVAHVGGAGTRLDQGLALFEAAGGAELSLVTAPLLV
ncbi:MAG: hypothetical protein ACPGQL_09945 [Thermoplasmatota archaeon]